MLTFAKGLAVGPPDRRGRGHARRVTASIAIGDLGSTFGGGPVPCAAALATIDVIEREGLIENAVRIGAQLARGARALGVRQVSGRGLLLGLHLDRPAAEVQRALFDRRILTGTASDPAGAPAAAAALLLRQRGRPAAGRPQGGAGVTKRDFLALEDWSPDEIDALLALAARVKRGEITGGLERKVLAMVFMDPSLRTRTSFETAMFLHGGHAVVLEPGQGKLAARDRARRGDGRRQRRAHRRRGPGARPLRRRARRARVSPGHATGRSRGRTRIVRSFAQHCEKPVINLESARRHPCQALADAMTLREKLGETAGKRFVLTWAWHPKALPTAVPASAALAAARLGMEIVIARPPGLRARSGGHRADPPDRRSSRAASSSTSSTIPTRPRWARTRST